MAKNRYQQDHGPQYKMSPRAQKQLKREGYRKTDGGYKDYYDSVVNDPRPEARSMKEYRSGKGLSHYAATYRADMKRRAKRGSRRK